MSRRACPSAPALCSDRGDGNPELQRIAASVPRAKWVGPDTTGEYPDWQSFTTLHDPATWTDVVVRYTRAQGATQLAVGGACALQHWSGDWLSSVLPIWSATAVLPELAPQAWQLIFDADLRPGFRRTIELIVEAACWPRGSMLSPLLVDDAGGPLLGHERRTCCLIRLGDNGLCAACRDQPAVTRRSRMNDSLRQRLPGPPVHVHRSLLAPGEPTAG